MTVYVSLSARPAPWSARLPCCIKIHPCVRLILFSPATASFLSHRFCRYLHPVNVISRRFMRNSNTAHPYTSRWHRLEPQASGRGFSTPTQMLMLSKGNDSGILIYISGRLCLVLDVQRKRLLRPSISVASRGTGMLYNVVEVREHVWHLYFPSLICYFYQSLPLLLCQGWRPPTHLTLRCAPVSSSTPSQVFRYRHSLASTFLSRGVPQLNFLLPARHRLLRLVMIPSDSKLSMATCTLVSSR